jgi:hypothetical protein
LVEAAAAAVSSSGAIRDNISALDVQIRVCLIVSKEREIESLLARSQGEIQAEIATETPTSIIKRFHALVGFSSLAGQTAWRS